MAPDPTRRVVPPVADASALGLDVVHKPADDVFAPSPIVVGASTASIDYFFTFEQHLNSIRIKLGAFNVCFQFIAAPNQLAHCAISKVALAVLDRLVCRILA